MVKEKFREFFIKWQQACYVCFPMMTQGDLGALTFSHWIKANCTGILAGIGAILLGLTWIKKYKEEKWFHGVTIGVACFFSDLVVHPSHFLGLFGEAFITAVCAGLLATLFVYYPLEINGKKIS